jgi:hypothetical protein
MKSSVSPSRDPATAPILTLISEVGLQYWPELGQEQNNDSAMLLFNGSSCARHALPVGTDSNQLQENVQ